MRYLLGCGYHATPDEVTARRDFAEIWYENNDRFAKPEPTRVVVLSSDNSKPLSWLGAHVLDLSGNLGHFMEIVNRQKPHKFNGWTGEVMALAMLAYCDEADFIYKEQDCLAFGPWVEKMYADIGEAGVLFGYKHNSEPWQCCSQSLFMVRHWYIPDFVHAIITSGDMGLPGQLGEHKFERFREQWPDKWKWMSFGVDRERPLPLDAPVFYCQQLKPEEIQALKDKGLV